jgi:hypothetical protein
MTDKRLAILMPFFEAAARGEPVARVATAALTALDAKILKIIPVENPEVDDRLRGTLIGLSAKQINDILGFKSNTAMDDGKQKYSWGFKLNGVEGLMWDWKGSYLSKEFMTTGPAAVFIEIFGADHYKAN